MVSPRCKGHKFASRVTSALAIITQTVAQKSADGSGGRARHYCSHRNASHHASITAAGREMDQMVRAARARASARTEEAGMPRIRIVEF